MDGAANQIVGVLAPEWRDRPDEILQRAEYLLVRLRRVFHHAAERSAVESIPERRNPRPRRVRQVMPVIFLAVAAMVLNMLMMRLIDQQRSVVGTLKALGYSNAQVFWHFMKFGGLVGLCGGLVGPADGLRHGDIRHVGLPHFF